MAQQEIIEANRLLAKFLGAWETEESYFYIPFFERAYKYEDMLFSSSWNWVMPVVEKIKQVCELTTECPINRKRVELFKSVSIFSDISEVYKCCAAFVKWYNENNAK